MTLTDLLTALYSDCGYDAVPSASVTARLTRYVSEAYHHILSLSEMSPLRESTLTFTSLPGVKIYGLPQSLVQVAQIVDSTSAIRLRSMTQDEFRAIDPQETASGRPTHYIPSGLHPVQRDPNQSDIWVQSGSPLDTTQTCTVSLVRNADTIDSETRTLTVTLNGTTPVHIIDFVASIQQMWLSAPAAGAVGLYDSGTVLTPLHRLNTIQPGSLTVQYLGIRLWPTPAGTYLYNVDGDLSMADLSTANPFPVIPVDFQLVLADFARMREMEYRSDDRYQFAQARYMEKLKNLRDRICDPPDYKPRVGKLSVRGNNLDANGVNYPSGRW